MQARVNLSSSTQKQKSCRRVIIEWMQKNPERCKNTTAPSIARSMVEDSGFTESTIRQTIPAMVAEKMLFRRGSTKRGDYTINYLHPQLIGVEEIQRNKTEADQKVVDKAMAMLNKAKTNGHPEAKLGPEGEVITRIEKKQPEPEQATQKEAKHIPVVYKTDETEETRVKTPITITKDRNGINLSINLTINLNN